MKPKQVCQFCEKRFKRVKGHYAFCKVRNAPTQTNMLAQTPTHYTWDDLQRQREIGRKEAEEQYKRRFTDTQIKAVEAAAKAVDALAHMVGELR
jgi:hypothetical protein